MRQGTYDAALRAPSPLPGWFGPVSSSERKRVRLSSADRGCGVGVNAQVRVGGGYMPIKEFLKHYNLVNPNPNPNLSPSPNLNPNLSPNPKP